MMSSIFEGTFYKQTWTGFQDFFQFKTGQFRVQKVKEVVRLIGITISVAQTKVLTHRLHLYQNLKKNHGITKNLLTIFGNDFTSERNELR